jgi:acyl carrier protein
VLARPAGARWQLTVRSQEDRGGAWTEHAIAFAADNNDRRPDVDVPALQARLREHSRPFGENLAGMVVCGPRWDCLGEAIRGADGDLIEIALPTEFAGDVGRHVVHPALLDVATGAAQRPLPGPCLPLYYERVTVYEPLPDRFFTHITYRTSPNRSVVVDLTLLAPDGQVLVDIMGFTLREVDPDRFTEALDRGTVLDTVDDSAVATAAPENADGIEPDAGVHLLMMLLSGRTPAHVLVRPFRDGHPVPLPTESAVAPAPDAVPPVAQPVASAAPLAEVDQAAPVPTERDEEVRDAIRQFWSGVLGIEALDDEDDFFDLGGNSMTAIQMMTSIRERFGVELSIATLFESPTVAALAKAVNEHQSG